MSVVLFIIPSTRAAYLSLLLKTKIKKKSSDTAVSVIVMFF